MKKSLLSLTAVVSFAIGIFASAAFAGELTHDQVVAAKTATALLVAPDGSGTAFCISDSGIFVTCEHVVENETNLSIIINPSQKDEKKYSAHVLRTFPKSDLAVLKVDLDPKAPKIPALKLGDDSTLFETQQLFAFGYPFGMDLASDEKSNPAISVNSGHVTSLRKEGDTLEAVQLDAMLNPGNSGGPVLDEKGDVIGIVAFGVPGSGVNFAVPVSLLKNEMTAPVLSVAAPEVAFDDRFKPADFAITVDWLTPPATAPAVTLEVTGGGQTRTAAAVKGADGKYHAALPPVIGHPGQKLKLHVTLEFESGVVSGQVDDFSLNIGGKPTLLSQIQAITPAPAGAAFIADGKPAGALPELGAMSLDMGGVVTSVDARKAKKIEIVAPSQDPGPVTYKVTVAAAAGGVALASAQGNVAIHSAPASAVAGPSQLTGVTSLTETKSIDLPSPADDVVAAQDGRALIFHLKDSKKLAVFDVVDLKFRGFINLAQEPALFAGGSRNLIVAYPSENVIERYSLQTLQKDRTITNPMGELRNLVMGYSSPRDALFTAKGNPFGPEVIMFNTDTMAVEATSKDDRKFVQLGGGSDTRMIVRASGDGRTYGFFRVGVSPTGFSIISYKNDVLSFFYQHESPGLLVPNMNGTEIFTSQTGIYTSEYVSVIKGAGNWAEGTFYMPSYSPSYFIGVPFSEMQSNGKGAPKPIAVYTEHSSQPLTYLEGFDEMTEKDGGLQPGYMQGELTITPDKRYHFYPQLNLFITIPATNNRIVAHPIDIKKILDAKGVDYLYSTTVAPQVKVSQRVNFKIEAVSKAGGVTFTLQSGPAGLTVGSDGTVNWQAPAKPGEESVIVTMKDASGQEAFYTFQLVVTQ
ncbi:MAG TPA: serine protease [Chthoniobacteraceae bacterium]|nr:serine protease [Chthoniobacteraceae bacterium]